MKTSPLMSRALLAAIGFLAVLMCAAQARAEQVVGQVTAVDLGRNVVAIDGVRYTIPAAVLERRTTVDTDKLARSLKPGQAVAFEAERGEIRKIQAVQGPIDLPLRSRGAQASGAAPARR
ncbi:MAG: hypothetical protein AB1418_03875 [Pseudomonadota bacterium]